jgi:nucleoside-diphosphate-sugar epimerase
VIVVVTGATGNLGTAVVRRLVARGHEVRGVARRAPAQPVKGCHVTEVDLAGPGRALALRQVLDGADCVVHTAWGFQPTRDRAQLYRLDVGGTTAVLHAASAAGVPHLVHVSSIGAYSRARDGRPVGEDWATGGTPQLPYSRHKSAVERMLDGHEAQPGHVPKVARVRPSLMGQAVAGGALDRYVLPSLLPAGLLRRLPVLPLDRRFRVQLTHTDDVAAAIVAMVEQVATGAFNLAAGPVLQRHDVADALGAPAVHLPWRLLRMLAAAAWSLRLQPVDPGWLDMAHDVPVISSERAERVLGWVPRHDSRDVLRETVDAMGAQTGGATPALRPRRWREQVGRLLRQGPVSQRPVA